MNVIDPSRKWRFSLIDDGKTIELKTIDKDGNPIALFSKGELKTMNIQKNKDGTNNIIFTVVRN